MHTLGMIWNIIIFIVVGGLFASPGQPSYFLSFIIGIFLIIAILITIRYLAHRFLDYLMYKNETPEERKTRQMMTKSLKD